MEEGIGFIKTPPETSSEYLVKTEHIFPVILMVEAFCASVFYFIQGNWRQGLFWLASDLIWYAMTF